MKLNKKQIESCLSNNSVSRGYAYFRNQRVLTYKVDQIDKQNASLTSSVDGSRGYKYIQNTRLTYEYGDLYIDGKCSCPMRWNCKHVAAVCYQFESDKQNTPGYQTKQWLNQLIDITNKSKSNYEYKENEFFLVYRLFENIKYLNHSNIGFYKSKRLKNGDISKGVKLSDYKIWEGDYNQFYSDNNDPEITSLYKSFHNRDDYKFGEIKGKIGFILMRHLIATQRCFYQDGLIPLSYCEQKQAINFSWQDVGDNSVQLVSNMQDGFYLIATDSVLVIDEENAIISQLASEVKAPVIKHLREAPPILKSKLADIYKNIIQQDINLDLPAPAGIKLITINEKPVPRLSLMRDPDVQPELIEDSHYMQLDFVYGQHKIPHFKPGDKWITFAENSKVEVIRNLVDETNAKNAITHLGFTANELQEQLLFSNPSIPSRQEALQRWQNFLEKQIPLLRQQGWQVEIDETFRLKFDSNPQISVESSHENDWFSMSFDLEINGVKSPMVPLVSHILENVENLDQLPEKLLLELAEGHFVSVQTKDVKPILNILMELFDRKDKNGQITVSAFDAHLLVDLDGAVNWKGDKEILKLAKRIKKFTGINRVNPPKDLQLELRDYQRSGLDWLNFLYEFKFGGILADDMGLGKTVQTLAHIAKLKESGKLKKPSLIIVPTSLVANWKNEAKKFTPSLKLLVLYGSDRFKQFSAVSNNDLVITSYALIVRDYELYKSIKFQYLILDEAQKIKNPRTKMTATINKLKSEYRLALSGTPIENHLGELWSIFNFLMPGFLKNLSQFKSYYQNPIEKQQDTYKQQLLNKRIQPFMLRRKKEDVLLELPAKTEIIKYTQFESKQAKLYEAIRISMEKKVKDAIANKGLNKSHITILDALLKLRQVCCDPSLLKLAQAQKTKESAKLTLFMQLLEELLLENRKILVFSQFTSMLKILEAGIISKKIKYTKLTGASRNREKIIQQFTDGQVDVFLISLKAGGVGLNLVEADTVIHYDPWWNPAVENQATDRAHRIGQNKQVFVYKLIVENTIEEKIIALQKKKQALQDGIYNKNIDVRDKKLSGNELMALLKSE